MPQYKQHQVEFVKPSEWYGEGPQVGDILSEFTFGYQFEIRSKDKVTFVGAPEGTKTKQTEAGLVIEMEKSMVIPKREVKLYFKTKDMFKPQLRYQVDEETGEVACLASFVPTFEPVQPQDDLKVSTEGPETQVIDGNQLCYIFLVDRSGSMGMDNRMETTKKALRLFI